MESTIGKAFTELIEKLEGWLSAIIQNIPNLILAIVVMFTAYFVARYIRKFVLKLVQKRVNQKSIANIIAKIEAIRAGKYQ